MLSHSIVACALALLTVTSAKPLRKRGTVAPGGSCFTGLDCLESLDGFYLACTANVCTRTSTPSTGSPSPAPETGTPPPSPPPAGAPAPPPAGVPAPPPAGAPAPPPGEAPSPPPATTTPEKQANGSPCEKNEDCQSSSCRGAPGGYPYSLCYEVPTSETGRQPGAVCSSDSQCGQNYKCYKTSISGTDRACGPDGKPGGQLCGESRECSSGLTCGSSGDGGTFRGNPVSFCTSNTLVVDPPVSPSPSPPVSPSPSPPGSPSPSPPGAPSPSPPGSPAPSPPGSPAPAPAGNNPSSASRPVGGTSTSARPASQAQGLGVVTAPSLAGITGGALVVLLCTVGGIVALLG